MNSDRGKRTVTRRRLKFLQPLDQDGRRSLGQGALQFAIALRAEQQLAHDEQRPAFAEQFGGLGHRTELSIGVHAPGSPRCHRYRNCSELPAMRTHTIAVLADGAQPAVVRAGFNPQAEDE